MVPASRANSPIYMVLLAKVVRVGAHYRPVAGGRESPWGREELDWQGTPTLPGKWAIEMVGASDFMCISRTSDYVSLIEFMTS